MAGQNIPHADVIEIISNYEFSGDPPKYQSCHRLSGGQGANENCLLKLKDNQTYLMKICDEKNEDSCVLWAKAVEHLVNHGFQTAAVVQTIKGNYVYMHHGRRVMMFDFIDGRSPESFTPPMAQQVGKELAKLHAIPLNDVICPMEEEGCCSVGQLGEFLEEQEKDARDRDEPVPEFVTYLRSEMNRLAPVVKSKEFSVGIIHTDIFPDNTMFSHDDKLLCFIDFEEVCSGPILLDLAMAVMSCCCKYEKTTGKVTLDREVASSMLRGYELGRQLSPLEKSSLDDFMCYAALIIAFWRYRNFNVRRIEESSPDELQRYREMVSICEFVKKDVTPAGGMKAMVGWATD